MIEYDYSPFKAPLLEGPGMARRQNKLARMVKDGQAIDITIPYNGLKASDWIEAQGLKLLFLSQYKPPGDLRGCVMWFNTIDADGDNHVEHFVFGAMNKHVAALFKLLAKD